MVNQFCLMTILVKSGDIEVPVVGITPLPDRVSPDEACAVFAQALHCSEFDEDENCFVLNNTHYTPSASVAINEEQFNLLQQLNVGLRFQSYEELKNCGETSQVVNYLRHQYQ